MPRRLTQADALSAWMVDGEINGHTVQQTLSFVNELQDVDERQRALPPFVILAGDCEPRWLTRLRARFGR